MKSVEKQEGLAEHVIQDTVRMDVSLRPHPLAKSPLQPMLLNDQQGNLTACSIQSVVVKLPYFTAILMLAVKIGQQVLVINDKI